MANSRKYQLKRSEEESNIAYRDTIKGLKSTGRKGVKGKEWNIMKYDLRAVKVTSLRKITETQRSLVTKLETNLKTVLRCHFEHPENPNLTFLENRLVIVAVNLQGVKLDGRPHQIGLLIKELKKEHFFEFCRQIPLKAISSSVWTATRNRIRWNQNCLQTFYVVEWSRRLWTRYSKLRRENVQN